MKIIHLSIGIGRPPGKMDPVKFVMRPFNREEREEVNNQLVFTSFWFLHQNVYLQLCSCLNFSSWTLHSILAWKQLEYLCKKELTKVQLLLIVPNQWNVCIRERWLWWSWYRSKHTEKCTLFNSYLVSLLYTNSFFTTNRFSLLNYWLRKQWILLNLWYL